MCRKTLIRRSCNYNYQNSEATQFRPHLENKLYYLSKKFTKMMFKQKKVNWFNFSSFIGEIWSGLPF